MIPVSNISALFLILHLRHYNPRNDSKEEQFADLAPVFCSFGFHRLSKLISSGNLDKCNTCYQDIQNRYDIKFSPKNIYDEIYQAYGVAKYLGCNAAARCFYNLMMMAKAKKQNIH